jgi:tRNA threonylcarbamoyladenosine biosynthesis protein TsaB
MKILALDTSTEWLSVAVFDGHAAVALRERAGNAASERVLPLVAQILARTATTLSALGGIAYGAGPGAFTGVRIACGIAQGLAFGAGIPVYGVSSLAAIAQTAWRTRGIARVVACIDARMREVYVAAYAHDDNGWTLASGPVVRRPGDVGAPPGGDWRGAGEGFVAYPQLADLLRLVDVDATIIPDARSIAELAWPKLAAGEGLPAAQAQPLYVRHRVALTRAERAAGMHL